MNDDSIKNQVQASADRIAKAAENESKFIMWSLLEKFEARMRKFRIDLFSDDKKSPMEIVSKDENK